MRDGIVGFDECLRSLFYSFTMCAKVKAAKSD